MKTNSIVLILFTLLFMTSCSRDSVEDNFIESESIEQQNTSKRGSITSCTITPALVINETATTGAPYTVYASSGRNTKNYDRRVEIYLTQYDSNGNEYVADAVYVTIPANENVSNNAAVINCGNGADLDGLYFDGNDNGDVKVKIANVVNLTNFSFDNSCSWRQTTGELPQCSSEGDGGELSPCAEGNDADGDGICDDIDPDGGNGSGFE